MVNRNGMRRVLWIVAAAAVLSAGCGGKNEQAAEQQTGGAQPQAGPATGQRRAAPGFTLKDIDGRDVRLADFKGKVVILDFWATWCPPCKMEIPHFVSLQDELGSQGLQVVGISMDQGGAAVVRTFAAQNRINYPMLLGDAAIAGQYGGIQAIPTTFVLDKQGRVVQRFLGYNEKSVFESLVKSLLRES